MRILVAFAILMSTANTATAGDWPQWLGPNRDGSSPEKVAAWKDAPKVVWKQAAGEGHSGLAVADGKVFLHAKVADKEEEELIALDAVKGDILWRTAYKRQPFANKFGSGPRATPAVAGGRVYTFGVTGLLTCFDAAEGKQLWQVDTLKKFEAPNLTFGVSSSPLIDGDRVVIEVGGKGASVVAFDAKTGEVVWKALDDKASYASTAVFGKGKDRELVVLTAANLAGLKPDDGSVLWKFPLVDLLNESSTTPVRIGDLTIGSSVTYGGVAVRVETTDGKQKAQEVWREPNLNCYFATPVTVGEQMYMVTGSILAKSATLRCVDPKTGKELWNRPKVGAYHASLLRTGDDKLLMLDDSGNLLLLDPNAKEYRELAKSAVCGPTWVHPALANGKLYIRDHTKVLCLQLAE
jgi:outer membrane protein assembly factor BamB